MIPLLYIISCRKAWSSLDKTEPSGKYYVYGWNTTLCTFILSNMSYASTASDIGMVLSNMNL